MAVREGEPRAVELPLVDEAGQMAIADALAIAGSARSVVLLGDTSRPPQSA